MYIIINAEGQKRHSVKGPRAFTLMLHVHEKVVWLNNFDGLDGNFPCTVEDHTERDDKHILK